MLDLFNIAKPQGCDIQIFHGIERASNTKYPTAWSKPRGVSNVYMMLIGAGGNGNGTTGGGSGAVTVWYGSAQNVPDVLNVRAGVSPTNSQISYLQGGTTTTLLRADSTNSSTGANAFTANQFCTSGFFQSIAGQNGTTGAVSASTTTFLSGGGTTGNIITANYGYSVSSNFPGFFLLSPIIVGAGGSGVSKGGIGCGGGASTASGGPGMVLIASW